MSIDQTVYNLEITISEYAGNHERDMAAYVFGFWLYDLEPSDYILQAGDMDDFKELGWHDEDGWSEKLSEIVTDDHGRQSTEIANDNNTFYVQSYEQFSAKEIAFAAKRCEEYITLYNNKAPSYRTRSDDFRFEGIKQFKIETVRTEIVEPRLF